MANAVYPKALENFLQADIDWAVDNIKVVLVSTKYNYSTSHEFLSSISSTQRVATSGNLASKAETGGVASAANTTFAGFSGVLVEAVVVYKDTGSAATSPLIAYVDTASGLPLTPNGAGVTIAWSTQANKIFKV